MRGNGRGHYVSWSNGFPTRANRQGGGLHIGVDGEYASRSTRRKLDVEHDRHRAARSIHGTNRHKQRANAMLWAGMVGHLVRLARPFGRAHVAHRGRLTRWSGGRRRERLRGVMCVGLRWSACTSYDSCVSVWCVARQKVARLFSACTMLTARTGPRRDAPASRGGGLGVVTRQPCVRGWEP